MLRLTPTRLLPATAAIAVLAVSRALAAPPSPPVLSASPAQAAQPLLTVAELQGALTRQPTDADASAAVAAAIRRMARGDARLHGGMPPKTQIGAGTMLVAWGIALPTAASSGKTVSVTTDDPNLPAVALTRVGTSDVYAAVSDTPHGLAGHWAYHVGDRVAAAGQLEEYPVNPEEVVHPGVPKGTVTAMAPFRSHIFEGTSRSWWVYVPSQYRADKPASVLVCQDGGGPRNWLPTILDNMIAAGELPPIVAIFVEPGKFDDGRSNRSVEYDTLNDKYAHMLMDEILPEVAKTTKLSSNPADRALYGVSSGGIAAFTVAWEHPEAFSKVDTCVGSFTNLQGGPSGVAGGNTYPAIIRHYAGWKRETKAKPITMYQTDGANDLDNAAGNWPMANEEIAKALDYGGYTHRLVFGNGFHGDRFGRYNMPSALRYLWATVPQSPQN